MNVLISGAGRGIGRETALYFASQGHHVALCSRTTKDLTQLRKLIEKKFPNQKVFAQPCDVTDKASVNSFTKELLKKWKQIDVLVNNAGTYFQGQIHNQNLDEIDLLMQTNFYSMVYLTKAVVPLMKNKKQGHIIVISSIAGLDAYKNGGAYSVSKFAVEGFAKNLRLELMPYKIKVTCIAPGAVLTESWKGTTLPKERFIPAKDIARIIYQCTNLSAQTCIENIVVRPLAGDV